jgi:ribonuclease III
MLPYCLRNTLVRKPDPRDLMQLLRRFFENDTSDGRIKRLVRNHFGLRVKNIAYYKEAFRHSSILDGDYSGMKSNERLEFLGDAVLDLSVAAYLYSMDPEAQEGLLTQRKSKIVSRKNLNLLGEFIEIEVLLEVKMRREDIRPTMVGNAMESLIGALYLDFGYVRTNKALISLLKRFGLDEKIHEITDFKSHLHHWAQKQRVTLSYNVVKEFIVDGENGYEVEVFADDSCIGSGTGRSKKIAEREASRMGWQNVFREEESQESRDNS